MNGWLIQVIKITEKTSKLWTLTEILRIGDEHDEREYTIVVMSGNQAEWVLA